VEGGQKNYLLVVIRAPANYDFDVVLGAWNVHLPWASRYGRMAHQGAVCEKRVPDQGTQREGAAAAAGRAPCICAP